MDEKLLRISEMEHPVNEILARFADRGTKCYLSVRKLKKESMLKPDDLRAALTSIKVSVGLDENCLEDICNRVNKGRPVQDALAAHTDLPQKGRDGYFDFHIKPFSLTPEYDENNLGKIDYHATHLFENVIPGQVIGYLIPAVPGKDGLAVTGEIIPADSANSFKLQVGAGVEKREKDGAYIVTKMGRVMVSQNVLSVTEVLLVEKDVDFNVGHINFMGFVQVWGDVLDGFTIYGKKGIQIKGNVGCTRLDSGGDIALGGMSVRENEGFIKSAGNIEAAYLNNVCVECEGNVHVHKEAVNCTILCTGHLTVDGRIVGGFYLALGGIEAGQIGTDMGVKTRIISGEDFHSFQQVEENKQELHTLQTCLVTLRKKCAFESQGDKLEEMPAEQKQQYTHRLEEINKLETKLAALQEMLFKARAAVKDIAVFKINIKKTMYAGTCVQLDCEQTEINESRLGACSIIPGPENTLKYEVLTPLVQG